ncbi:MAG: hypothetical protein WHT08_00885 [Bryobacteraceae bacterium]
MMRAFWQCAGALLFAVLLPAETPDPAEIVRRSVERDRLNFERANDYSYIQHTEQRRLDKNGRVVKVESRTYDVIVLDGEPYEKLIAKDGKPLPEAEARKEQEKLDRELSRRRSENPESRSRRLRELEKRRREGREFAQEIPEAFQFRLAGEEILDGRPVWVIDAEPRPGFKPKARRADLLPKFRGRLWIDQQDYQWVRVEAETIAPVSFGWILARLDPGARMTFEQRRVHGEVWLPSHARMQLGARLALLRKIRAEVEVSWRDYRKFQSESRITGYSEAPPEP